MTSLQLLPLSERWTARCSECLVFRHDCKKGGDDCLRCFACHSRVQQGHPSRREVHSLRPWYQQAFLAIGTSLNLWAEDRGKHAAYWGDWPDLGADLRVDPEELCEYLDSVPNPDVLKGWLKCQEAKPPEPAPSS